MRRKKFKKKMENLHSTPRIKQEENNKKYSALVVLFLWF